VSVYVLVTKITSPESIKIEVKHTQNRGFASASWVLYSSRDKSHAIKLCNICSPSSNKIEVLHSEYRGSGSGPPNCSISCDMPRAIKLCNICSPSNYKSRFCTQSIEDLAADLLIAIYHVTDIWQTTLHCKSRICSTNIEVLQMRLIQPLITWTLRRDHEEITREPNPWSSSNILDHNAKSLIFLLLKKHEVDVGGCMI
jgi:hypothetical protein